MGILVGLLALALLGLWWRVRRLERRLEQLHDKTVDWRLGLGRRQEDLAEEIQSLGRGTGTGDPGSARAEAALVQIRPRAPSASEKASP